MYSRMMEIVIPLVVDKAAVDKAKNGASTLFFLIVRFCFCVVCALHSTFVSTDLIAALAGVLTQMPWPAQTVVSSAQPITPGIESAIFPSSMPSLSLCVFRCLYSLSVSVSLFVGFCCESLVSTPDDVSCSFLAAMGMHVSSSNENTEAAVLPGAIFVISPSNRVKAPAGIPAVKLTTHASHSPSHRASALAPVAETETKAKLSLSPFHKPPSSRATTVTTAATAAGAGAAATKTTTTTTNAKPQTAVMLPLDLAQQRRDTVPAISLAWTSSDELQKQIQKASADAHSTSEGEHEEQDADSTPRRCVCVFAF